MNRTVLQIFLLLAFIPLAILVGYGVLVVAPIFCCFLAINSYKFKNYKEMYIWMGSWCLVIYFSLIYAWGIMILIKIMIFCISALSMIAGIVTMVSPDVNTIFLPIV
jgi:hypothetical protein